MEKSSPKYYRFKRACFISQKRPSMKLFELSNFLQHKLLSQQTIHNIINHQISNPIVYKTPINKHIRKIDSPSDDLINALLESYCSPAFFICAAFLQIAIFWCASTGLFWFIHHLCFPRYIVKRRNNQTNKVAGKHL